MRIILSLLFLAALVAAVPQEISYSGNITEDAASFEFRYSHLSSVGNNLLWISGSVAAHGKSSGETGAKVDTLVSYINGGMPIVKSYLWSWMLYVHAAYDSYMSGMDFKGFGGAIGTIYKRIQEYDKDDKLVLTTELTQNWAVSNQKESTTDGKTISYATLSFNNNKVKTSMTYIASNVAGVLSYGNAKVSPKSLQCVVEIEDYKYADVGNYLTLTIGVLTSKVKFSGNALISKYDDSNVHFTLASHAIINGTQKEIHVSEYKEAAFGLLEAETYLKVFLQKDVEAHEVTVTFPANAKTIIYDPSYGQGQVLYGASSGLVPSILILALLALLL